MPLLLRAIEDAATLVGTISSFDMEGDRELTYWIDPMRWGRGIATAALRAFLELELRRPLHARAAAHNPRSIAILRRSGFARVGEDRSWSGRLSATVEEHLSRLDASEPALGSTA